jgi:ribonuclease BN (tRNA processing enzyme)
VDRPVSTQLVLLGTAGGPILRGGRRAPAQVILVDDAAYLVDCGNGVAWQLHRAGVPFSALRAVCVTHHHSDHNADVGTLFLLGWSGLVARVPVIGPPPLEQILVDFLAANRYDIDTRMCDEDRPCLAGLIEPREIAGPGVVHADDKVRITAALVEHPPVSPAFAYRVDTADRSIVISGDTRPCDALVELASGADTLVHEVLYPPAVDGLATRNDGQSLRRHLLGSHTPVDQVGTLAERAGVATLVLSHFVPSCGTVDDDTWHREAQRGYRGRVVVGHDLQRL